MSSTVMALSLPKELNTKEMVSTVLSVPQTKAAIAANNRAITPINARYFDLSRTYFMTTSPDLFP
jgi:hypothetical protein